MAEPSYDGLSADVRRRAELRQLVGDIARLPADQREALVLFELGGRSQTEIASVIGCAEAKVKALVFQARSALIAERDARDTPPAATSRLSSTALATKVAVTAALAGAGAGGGAALVDNPGGPAPAPGPPRVEQSVAKQATTGQAAASGELSVTRSGEAGELSTREPQPAIAEASATTPGVTGPRRLTPRRRAIRRALGVLGSPDVRPPRPVRRRIRRAIRHRLGRTEPTSPPSPRRVLRRLLQTAPPDDEAPVRVRPRLRRQQPAAEPEATEPAAPPEPEALAEPVPGTEPEPQPDAEPEPVAPAP